MGEKPWLKEYYQNFFIAVLAGIVVAIATPVTLSGCRIFDSNCNLIYLKFLGYIILLFIVGAIVVFLSEKLFFKKYLKKKQNREFNLLRKGLIIFFILILILFFFNIRLNYWAIVVFIILCLIYKCMSSANFDNKSWMWLTQLIITLIVIGFVSNELISPLISPRVSDIKITPLYIQSEQPPNPKDGIKYYTLFQVEYEIEFPYFLMYDKLNLRLPGKSIYQNIDLITSLQENNPYYEIDLSEELLDWGSFLSYEKINGILPIKIKTNSREIKRIYAKFIIREINDIHGINFERSDNYWWTHSTISPIESTGNVVTHSHMSLIGFGRNQWGDYYRFYDVVIKSLTDLEIKGLSISVTERPIFCDEGIELNKEYKYISIDLQPREIKHMLAVSKVPETKKITETNVVFNFTSETPCYGQWLKYKELIGKK